MGRRQFRRYGRERSYRDGHHEPYNARLSDHKRNDNRDYKQDDIIDPAKASRNKSENEAAIQKPGIHDLETYEDNYDIGIAHGFSRDEVTKIMREAQDHVYRTLNRVRDVNLSSNEIIERMKILYMGAVFEKLMLEKMSKMKYY